MIRGLYIAATGMQTQKNRLDVVTNNLANAGTTGFKEDTLVSRSFQDVLVSRMEDPAVVSERSVVGPMNNGVHIDEIRTSFANGSLKETGLTTDLALLGDGFFAVLTPDGERYTRAGNFAVSADGQLTTIDGHLVLGQDGPVRVGNTAFSINGSGEVQSDNGIDQLRLVRFADNGGLRKEGSGLFTNYDTTIDQAAPPQVRQGYLENANVDLTSQVVNMITIQRNFELNQRVLKIMDERLGRAVNDIGKL